MHYILKAALCSLEAKFVLVITYLRRTPETLSSLHSAWMRVSVTKHICPYFNRLLFMHIHYSLLFQDLFLYLLAACMRVTKPQNMFQFEGLFMRFSVMRR